MAQLTMNERVFEVYKQFYQYKDLLKGAPRLSIEPSSISSQALSSFMPTIELETKEMVGYLLGLRGAVLPVDRMLASLNQYYQKDDFWRRLLLTYIEIAQEKDEAVLSTELEQSHQTGKDLLARINAFRNAQKEIITSFAQVLKSQKYPVDEERLFKNYLKMSQADPDEAWKILISNPAAFSPLQVVTKEGKRLMSPKDAKELNKKMGDFIRKMKA